MASPQVHVPQKHIMEPRDPGAQARWVATLDDGTVIVGKPSYAGNSGSVALPQINATDWQRLRLKCQDEGRRITELTLAVLGETFSAPTNRAAYGFAERVERNLKGARSVTTALMIYWADKTGPGAEGYRVLAEGVLEGLKLPQWPSSMIGSP